MNSVNLLFCSWAWSSDLPYYTFFCLFRGWFESFLLLITLHLKTNPRNPLPPVTCRKEPCAGRLDLKESLILRRRGDGRFLPRTNHELYLKRKIWSGNWPFWLFFMYLTRCPNQSAINWSLLFTEHTGSEAAIALWRTWAICLDYPDPSALPNSLGSFSGGLVHR